MILRDQFVWNDSFWTPSQISTALWLDAADSSTITLNGSTVSQWSDKSGNARHATQPTAANQPAYSATGFNSRPGVVFTPPDSLSTGVTLATMFQADSSGGYLVGQGTTTTSGLPSFNVPWFWGDSNGYKGVWIRNQTPTVVGMYNWDANEDTVSTPYVFSTPSMIEGSHSGGNILIRLNGGAASTAPTGSTQVRTGIVWIAARSLNGNNLNGSIGELVLTNTALGETDRQRLEGYLAWKWGLVADLPANHPYKINPPLR
jgi:hypothetical protein